MEHLFLVRVSVLPIPFPVAQCIEALLAQYPAQISEEFLGIMAGKLDAVLIFIRTPALGSQAGMLRIGYPAVRPEVLDAVQDIAQPVKCLPRSPHRNRLEKSLHLFVDPSSRMRA